MREIDQGLRKAIAVVVTLTPNAINKHKHPWAYYEHQEALRLFAPIIPVKLAECDLPDYFADENIQSLDAITLDDDSIGRIKAAIEKKIRRRGRHLTDQTQSSLRQFVGREIELREVYCLPREDRGVAVAAVQGMGGIGKTMLAEELLRRLGPRYPGGVIVERRGTDPEDLESVLQKWAGYALGEKPTEIPTPEQVCGLLSGAGELIVLIDDVWPDDFAAVQTLLKALPPDAERIITTRFADGAEAIGARTYRLQCLSKPDALDLLRDRLRDKGPEPEETLLEELVDLVGGHALALELAASRVKDTARLENEVRRFEARIEGLNLDEIDLRLNWVKIPT